VEAISNIEQTIPKVAKIVLRIVGAVNAALALLGAWCLADSSRFFLTGYAAEPSFPYFRLAFVVMMLINVTFLVILLVTAIRFIQVKICAVNSYSAAVLGLVVYDFTIRALWQAGCGIGTSIAAATGVGNMGVGPFVFCFLVAYLYPVASIVLLQVLRRCYSPQHTLASA